MRAKFLLLMLIIGGVARGQRNVEGLYQLAGNPTMFIRFTERDGELVARFLWDETAEVHFLPDSGLVFIRKDEGEDGRVHIRFRRDEQGRVVHVTMGNGTEWDRSDGAAVSAERLKELAGNYQSVDHAENRLVILAGDSSLVVKQLSDGQETLVVPLSSTFFYSPTRFYTLTVLPSRKRKTPREIRLMNRENFRFTGK